ncbi:hypothetical protein SDC9_203555 [bioreactor metagenome]|uniref:Uncharacterized protein n=1 Tax=bioreactor metagenome TaxID=1076179 RepID=A0A645IX04_9ZZZZ
MKNTLVPEQRKQLTAHLREGCLHTLCLGHNPFLRPLDKGAAKRNGGAFQQGEIGPVAAHESAAAVHDALKRRKEVFPVWSNKALGDFRRDPLGGDVIDIFPQLTGIHEVNIQR